MSCLNHELTWDVSGGIARNDHVVARCSCLAWRWIAKDGVDLGEIEASWRRHVTTWRMVVPLYARPDFPSQWEKVFARARRQR